MTALVSILGSNGDVNVLPRFSAHEVLHILDLWAEDYLQNVIQKKGRPAYVLSDHVLTLHADHVYGLNFRGLPLWSMREVRLWSWQDFKSETALTTDHVFNFTVNTKQCSRFIMMRLVEINKFTSYQYTWSGVGRQFDMSVIIDEIEHKVSSNSPIRTPSFRNGILAPINLPVRFFTRDQLLDHEDSKELETAHPRTRYGGAKWTWDNFLKDMFTKTAVSLISETGGYQKLSVLTEKTIYAFLGLTFPIWIGNWGQADAVAQLGLDVFPDVIDHSYQWYPTLIERCYWAVELNKPILSDLEHATALRKLHLDRLLCNRAYILNDGLGDYCTKQIAAYPDDLRTAAETVKQKFDTLIFIMSSLK